MRQKSIPAIAGAGIFVGVVAATIGSVALANTFNNQGKTSTRNYVTTSDSTASSNMSSLSGIGGPGSVAISVQGSTSGDLSVLNEALAKEVAIGTITQDQANSVTAYVQAQGAQAVEKAIRNAIPNPPNVSTRASGGPTTATGPTVFSSPGAEAVITYSINGGKPVTVKIDLLADLVTNGTITSAQAEAIRNDMNDIINRQAKQQWQSAVDTLVSQGTITQAQADKIMAFIAKLGPTSLDGPHSVLRMETVQRAPKASTQAPPQNVNHTVSFHSPKFTAVNQMVSQGIITQQQANALMQKMAESVWSGASSSGGESTAVSGSSSAG